MTEKELLEKLAKLNGHYSTTRAVLSDLHKSIVDTQRQIVRARYGITEGTEVVCHGKHYRVSNVLDEYVSWDASRDRKPWIKGRRVLKDGTTGEREVRLYTEWEVVK